MLEVVQQEQQPPVSDRRCQLSGRSERATRRVEDGCRVGDGGERNPPDSLRVLVRGGACCLQRESGLATAARAGEGQQPRPREELADLAQLPVAPEERRRRYGQVRLVERLQRREVVRSELVDAFRGGEVLEAVLAQIAQLGSVHEARRRRRDEHLRPVPGRRNPRRPMHIDADVALLRDERRPRVNADPHPDRPVGERVRQLRGRRQCPRCGREGDEERVALRVHLDPAMRRRTRPGARAGAPPEQPHTLRPKLVQEPRRTLHIRKQERDRAAGQLAHASSVEGWRGSV